MPGETPETRIQRKPTKVEDALLGTAINKVPGLVPGVLLAAAVVVGSIRLADWANASWGFKGLISYIMVAIVVGILVRNTVGLHSVFVPGVNFCLKKLLRLGIILMGIRLSFLDVVKIGGFGIPIVLAAVLTGMVVTTYATRLLKLPERLGTLIAIGTGICGASAIVATAPGIKAKDEEIAYAVANITVFGIMAMLVYPYLGHLIFGGDITLVGLFTGTSIHETAQVAGAGLIYDQTFQVAAKPSVADVAIVTKLVRNALMVVAIPAVTFYYARRISERGEAAASRVGILQLVPLFIVGFLALAVLRSIGDAGVNGGHTALGIWNASAWSTAIKETTKWSGYILATAMAGVGLGTSLKAMRGLGLKPFLVGIVAATSVGAVAILLVFLLGRLVTV